MRLSELLALVRDHLRQHPFPHLRLRLLAQRAREMHHILKQEGERA